MIISKKLLLLVVAGVLSAGSAQATVIYDTGVGTPGTVDPNWTITASTGSAAPGTVYIQAYAPPTFPFNYWAAPIAGSNWITPNQNAADSFDPSGNGLYTYSESFFASAGTVITGSYLSDNTVTSITLQPTSPLESVPGSGSYVDPASSFTFAALATAGYYTLNFNVENLAQNGGNPSGLDVSVSAVPEPATWAMMILGFLGIGFLGYRKSSKYSGASFRMV